MGGGLLGSKTGDFLTWVTIVLVAVFLTLAVLMGRFYRPSVGEYGADEAVATQQPAADAPTPAPDAPTPAADTPAPAADTPAPAADTPAPDVTEAPDVNSTGG